MQARTIRIIGLDPGLRRTGWGVIESDGVRLIYVASGVITPPTDDELAYRLRALFEGVSGVIASFKPSEAAVEETFVNENPRSTLKLGQARGTVLLAPAMAGLKVAEYTPNLIKKSVVGSGHAEKRPDPGDGQIPDAQGDIRQRRRSRRAGDCHYPRQSSGERQLCLAAYQLKVADMIGTGT